jgi:endonuclease YncB( thermonuclease family)
MLARTLVPALLVVTLLAGCGGSGQEPGGASVTVERIVDGDTLVLTDERRVRLVQIDAPEDQDGECYAAEATEALEELVPAGTAAELEADPALDDVDRFGRLLRYVLRDEANANLELVRRGAAAPWFFDGDRGRYADELLDAAEAAQETARGLWGACPGTRLDPTRAVDTGG